MQRLFEYISSVADEDISSLTIQDLALCQVWLANRGPESAPFDGYAILPHRIQDWLSQASSASRPSEGRRSQTLLRELIDRLEAGQVDTLKRDELDLLEAVFGLAQAAHHADTFERVRRAIAPYRTRIASRRKSVDAVIGVPTLASRMLVVTPEDIAAAPQREVRMLAGVELPSRGPVLAHNGHLRVLGDVPQNATLVVEEAACVVDGFVMGRIAATGSCEILENVSGVTISRNGDIRARNIVDGAYVVAKRGWIHCRRCQGAQVAFAGSCLRVVEHTARSRLFAPHINLEATVDDSELHTSRRVEADLFRNEGNRPLQIVFHRSLSCKDYGENPGKTMASDVSRAIRLRGQLWRARQELQMAVQSAEQSAEAALMHLFGGEESSRMVKEMATAQRRLEVLHRIVLGMRTMYSQAEAGLEGEDDENSRQEWDNAANLVKVIEDDIDHLLSDLPDETELRGARTEMSTLRTQFADSSQNRHTLTEAMVGLGDRLTRWRHESEELGEKISKLQGALRKKVQTSGIFGQGPMAKSRVLSLQKVLSHARTQDPASPLNQRMESAFVGLMLKTIHKRLAEAQKHKSDVERLHQNFQEARDLVWTEYQMRVADDDSAETVMVAEGRFGSNVKLYADPIYALGEFPDVPAGGSLSARDTGSNRTRYTCRAGIVQEEPFAVEALEPIPTSA